MLFNHIILARKASPKKFKKKKKKNESHEQPGPNYNILKIKNFMCLYCLWKKKRKVSRQLYINYVIQFVYNRVIVIYIWLYTIVEKPALKVKKMSWYRDLELRRSLMSGN